MIHPGLTLAIHEGMAVAVAGAALRGKVRLCASFFAYLATVLGVQTVTGVACQTCFTWSTWLVQESVFAGLKLLVIAELAHRIFERLPRARAVLMGMVFGSMMMMLFTLLRVPSALSHEIAVERMLPLAAMETSWMLVLVLAMVVWYRLPLHPWHTAIILGLTGYLGLAGVLKPLVEVVGWQDIDRLDTIEATVYLAATLYWAHAAWRRTRPDPVHEPVLAFLQPWRA